MQAKKILKEMLSVCPRKTLKARGKIFEMLKATL